MIKTILIDYDNTLHDSDSKFIARFEGLAQKLGLSGRELWDIYLFKIHREMVHKKFPERHDDERFHAKLILRYLGLPCEGPVIRRLVTAYKKALEECVEKPSFFPDTFEFLNQVSGRYKLCLATYANAREKSACLERFGGRRYFDYIFRDHNISFHKHTPQFYEEVLRISGSKPEETANIGDALVHDVIPAKLIKIKTIWINRKGEIAPEGSKPDHEVKNLLEALEYL
ncbi:MAG: HAD family hydrolase [Candidatus Aenigmarchaeota archaeon]|nr:HAD family hydrolase [Candidatus Aenigmarchaeota archaeon]